jgi:hypothetical protein
MLRAIRSFLYGATPASFESPYTMQESVERLRAATKRSVFGALTAQAAVGKVSEGRVLLQRAIPFVGNSFKPFFVGHFESSAGGTRLVGHFTMHWLVKVFNTFWFGFCLLWTVSAIGIVGASGTLENWYFPFFGVGMLALGTLLVQVGKWFARNDAAWLTNVITNALSAKSAG